ncbi:MAG: efflux RND transporter periplasmic adaptor subunit [Lachnospirales bacterium]
MKKKKKIIGLVIVVAVGLGGCFAYNKQMQKIAMEQSSLLNQVTTTPAVYVDAKESISTSGNVDYIEIQSIYAESEGRIESLYAKVGDEITEDTELVVYDTSGVETLEESLEDANYSLDTAKINLDGSYDSLDKLNNTNLVNDDNVKQLESSIVSAKNSLKDLENQLEELYTQKEKAIETTSKSEDEYAKQQILYNNGIISQKELDEFTKAIDTSEDSIIEIENKIENMNSSIENANYNIEIAEYNYNSALNPDTSDLESQKEQARNSIEISEIGIEQAENNIDKIKDKIDDFVPVQTCYVNGVVKEIFTPVGTTVGKGTKILDVVDISYENLVVKLSVNQRDISSIEVGQEVEITSSGIGDEVIIGTVSKVMPSATVEQSSTSKEAKVEVQVTFNEDVRGLKAGFIVDAIITTKIVEDAVAVPIIAIQRNYDEGYDYVNIQNEDETIEERKVTLGVISGTNIVVTGVSEGEKVVTSSVDDVSTDSPTD